MTHNPPPDPPADIEAAIADIAGQLNETDPQPLDDIRRIVERLGVETAYALLEETKEIEATGGVLTHDGQRRRTFGGAFFFVVRGRISPEDHAAIWPDHRLPQRLVRRAKKAARRKEARTVRARLEWPAALKLLPQLQTQQGAAMSVKLTLIGRPGKVIDKGEVIVTTLTSGKPPPLPKELPPPPEEPTVYLVFMTRKQWTKAAAALEADPEELLVIEGYPALDKKLGVIGVLAHKVALRET